MAATISVIPVSEGLAAMKEGQKIVKIVAKPPGKDGKMKTYQAGTVYFDLGFTVKVKGKDGKEVTKTCKGDFSYDEVITGRPPLNKDDPEDDRQQYVEAGKEPTYQIQTSMNKGGELAEFLVLLDAQIEEAVNAAASGPNKIQGFITKDRKYHHLVQTHIQDEQSEHYGEAIEDPLIRIKVKSGNYSDKFFIKSLQGKPQSEFLDGNTERVVAGKYVYDPAYCLGDDGEPIVGDDGKKVPVTPATLWHYLTSGSKIKGRINMNSIAINKAWVSPQLTAPRTIIWRGTGGEAVYEDELAAEPDTPTESSSAPTPQADIPVADKVNAFISDLEKAEDDLE